MDKESQFADLFERFEAYPGKYYLRYEQEELRALLATFHGFYLVQLANKDIYHLESSSTIMKQVYVANADQTDTHCFIQSSMAELPFQAESVDAFILPHTLEFVKEPTKLLNEIYNILIPGGRLVILGFNPLSIVGLAKLFKSPKDMPWCGKLYTPGHIKFWLRASGFSLEHQKSFCYRPPLKNETVLKKLFFMELLGQFCFPYLGSAYILLAEKKQMPVSPLRLKPYTKKIPVTRGFPEPTTNKSS